MRRRNRRTAIFSFALLVFRFLSISLFHDGARIGVGNEEKDIVSMARVCSTLILRGGCNVARKNTVNSTATGPVCLPQKRRPSRSSNMTVDSREYAGRLDTW